MKSLEEFAGFRDKELAPALEALKAELAKSSSAALNALSLTALAGAVAGFLTLLFSKDAKTSLIVGGVFLGIALLAWGVIYFSGRSKANGAFKAMVVRRIVAFMDPNLRYIPGSMVPQCVFQMSEIYTQGIDRYSGEDLVKGSFNGVELEFSELHAEYKTTTTDSKGRTTTHWHTIFKGVFMAADFNKDFNTRTVVVPDTAESAFGSLIGNFLQKMNFSRSGQLVKLESPDFEKAFAVYGDDQVEARYILTPSLMERIMALRARFGEGLALSFVGSKLLIAIPSSRNLFELDSAVLNSPTGLNQAFFDLSHFLGIVEDLNLETRIWSKV